MVHSMHTDGVAHGPATLFLHSGSQNFIRPSMGSWIQYGIGSENEDLPGFVSLAPSIGNGGARNYGSAFLPAKFQGTPIGKAGNGPLSIDHLQPIGGIANRSRLDQIQALNQIQLEQRSNGETELDAAIESYEMAWKMQSIAQMRRQKRRDYTDWIRRRQNPMDASAFWRDDCASLGFGSCK